LPNWSLCVPEQDEAARLAVLREHDLEQLFDDPRLRALTDFTAELCEVPVCLISLVEEDRQCFLARTGADIDSTPRNVSFCQYAMIGNDVMIVADATLDPRFKDNPLVTGDFGLRFYAGAPLHSTDGVALGALCIIDRKPRQGLTDLQLKGLRVLATQVASVLQASRSVKLKEQENLELTNAIQVSEESFRILADTMPQMVWSAQPDGYHDYYNARWYEYTGMPAGSTDGEAWNGMFHPEDQGRAWERWRHSLKTGEPYEIEYRLRAADGTYRWTLGRALPMRDAQGNIVRWFGTCTDIHDQKLLLEQRQHVSQELSHRIKNIFSIIAGIISLATRRYPESRQLAGELRERILALGRAHDFVRPHSPSSAPPGQEGSLQGMLTELFLPYRDGDDPRIVITGEDIKIDDRAATPLALVFHELATNAAKYGALSAPSGRVSVAIATSPADVLVTWKESGGPELDSAPPSEGFGSQLIGLSGSNQLRADIVKDWKRSGLELTARIPRESLYRSQKESGS
jgi:PAS domain S-box-containing protein